MPIEDLIVPCLIVPASVTPKCNGYGILLDNLRYASIIKGTSVALMETFIWSYSKDSKIRICSKAVSTIPSAVGCPP